MSSRFTEAKATCPKPLRTSGANEPRCSEAQSWAGSSHHLEIYDNASSRVLLVSLFQVQAGPTVSGEPL